ncbi:MAG: hypothetical protein LBH12_07090 [Dysgonamonadaceae bacterium]|jgi:hypothetical protein|nr:hypothetical protein [Dysgonamonadaceae bacterium]
MASIKKLKKNINQLSIDLFSECIFAQTSIPNVDKQKVDEITVKILQKQTEFLSESKHTDGKKNPALVKKHYATLKANIRKHTDDIVSDIENLYK